MYRFEFTPQAFADLRKLAKPIQKKVIEKLEYFVESGNPLSFASHLINTDIGTYRFRIGDWRVIFDVEGETIIILTLGHRKEINK
jgi:mRNA interferase RelE/StbE